MNYDMKQSGNRIRLFRTKSGLTQEATAAKLNIDRSYYSRIEAGKKGCSIDIFIQLSEMFHTSLDYLVTGRCLLESADKAQMKENIENLPTLSAASTEDGMIDQTLRTVTRKGKSHYVCDRRLERRLGQLDLNKKNWKAGTALLSLREQLDTDSVTHLSSYDRDHVCVPQTCDDCNRESCRYLALRGCSAGRSKALPFPSTIAAA